MAPPPEYDKEPKAPDKSATNVPSEDSKALYSLVNDHQTNSDYKSTSSSANAEVENNKHVETLDDGQLRALLDEAITYKCPKDREGKSSLFKELLEEVEQDEQDEQACEAAARLPGGRARRGGRGRRALPHSNSLQDLVAALAAEPAPRRARHPPAPVSARAHHGGSLPSGVDTSFLLSEEPMRGAVGAGASGTAEYVATVRCVNPSPLAERRVSASDAHCPDADALNRRSKPVFPMYTARATLEIGSGSVCSGRAVTTTTASNQVRTPRPARGLPRAGKRAPRGPGPDPRGERAAPRPSDTDSRERSFWDDGASVDKWYRGLEAYDASLDRFIRPFGNEHKQNDSFQPGSSLNPPNGPVKIIPSTSFVTATRLNLIPKKDKYIPVNVSERAFEATNCPLIHTDHEYKYKILDVKDVEEAMARQAYRELVGNVAPSRFCNPTNVRGMSIGPSSPVKVNTEKYQYPGNSDKPGKDKNNRNRSGRNPNVNVVTDKQMPAEPAVENKADNQSKIHHHNAGLIRSSPSHNRKKSNAYTNTTPNKIDKQSNKVVVIKENSQNNANSKCNTGLVDITIKEHSQHQREPVEMVENTKSRDDKLERDDTKLIEMVRIEKKSEEKLPNETVIEDNSNLVEMVSMQTSSETEGSNEFSLFLANQDRLLRAIETNNCHQNERTDESSTYADATPENIGRKADQESVEKSSENPFISTVETALNPVSKTDYFDDKDSEPRGTEMVDMKRAVDFKVSDKAELGSASYFLTLYKRLLASPCNIDPVDMKPDKPGLDNPKLPKKKKDKITSRLSRKPHNENSNKKKDIIRNALKMLFFDNITQSDSNTKLAGASSAAKEVDSAIPFSCITTPEVVASCTTTASAQAAVVVDPKPARSAAPGGARAGPAGSAAADEFKKSLDENGNSVQGFSSPQSGSSQQKKQRRKKSSKNETVIKSHHIDGYQGNKDLNEVLRFIESNEPERPKRHDDKKKRSAERRKDKAPRASSLDDLSRAAPAPARPARPALPAPKPERRSWGDERQAFYFRDPNPEPDPELTDFQTVTKKRKPRRRTDEPERERQRPRAPSPRSPRSPRSPPSPRARSERSNDSNDDLDSVHSLPALPARPAPPASYADIARTKHNIPDLIESCNYYGEGPEARAGPAPPPGDEYPALERPRRKRAPDVVADRRPPVILLDEAARPRDMDGVTFGFDVNEQLLGAAPRRPRCDLVRDAPGLAVRAGCAALRYVAPAQPPDDHHLHQIVDYVGTAWEDVVRCGGGKVRYYSE